MKLNWVTVAAWTLIVVARGMAVPVLDESKPVLLYSRYFNAAGEARYLPDGSYKDILGQLRADVEVRVHGEPLTRQTLGDVRVVVIANPSDQAVGTNPPPPHVSKTDIDALVRFVERGGGLIVMGNQENHNLEIADFNRLLTRFGFQFTNAYTDVKKLELPATTPIIGGLRWGYYTGNSVLIETNHAAKPRVLVANDLSVKPLNGERNAAGALLAIAEPGRGRVVVITDAGWISNDVLSDKGIGGVSVQGQDNAEIFRRLVRWVSGNYR